MSAVRQFIVISSTGASCRRHAVAVSIQSLTGEGVGHFLFDAELLQLYNRPVFCMEFYERRPGLRFFADASSFLGWPHELTDDMTCIVDLCETKRVSEHDDLSWRKNLGNLRYEPPTHEKLLAAFSHIHIDRTRDFNHAGTDEIAVIGNGEHLILLGHPRATSVGNTKKITIQNEYQRK